MSILLTPEPEVLSPKEQELQAKVTALTAKVPVEITSDDQRIKAIEIGRELRQQMSDIEQAYDDLISDAHSHHKKLLARKAKYFSPLKVAYDAIERAITSFKAREEAKRLELERQMREAALKVQQDALMAEAALLERQGDTEAAHEIVQEALMASAPVVVAQPQVSKQYGEYTRPLPWKFEIRNQALIKEEYWVPDLDAIAAIVRAKGEMAESIIGRGSIRIYRETKTIIKK